MMAAFRFGYGLLPSVANEWNREQRVAGFRLRTFSPSV